MPESGKEEVAELTEETGAEESDEVMLVTVPPEVFPELTGEEDAVALDVWDTEPPLDEEISEEITEESLDDVMAEVMEEVPEAALEELPEGSERSISFVK